MTDISFHSVDLLYLKIPLVLAATICNHLISRRPNPPVNEDERLDCRNGAGKHLDLFGRIALLFRATWICINYVLGLCDTYITICYLHPAFTQSSLHSHVIRHVTGHPQFTPGFSLGCLIVYTATYVRLLCFRTLGEFFTFELAIRKNHKLCTHGPYSIVRHPSYAATLAAHAGLSLCFFGSGSVWSEFSLGTTLIGTAIMFFWIGLQVLLVLMYVTRMRTEDIALKASFEQEWVKWYEQTPYKLIPWVY